MDFKVIWTDPAIDGLREIVGHIAQDNQAAAQALGLQLVAHMEIAAPFPRIGPLYSQHDGFEIRCLTYRDYRLYYRIGILPNALEVVAVRHCAREQPEF